jgi:hypothetical protein
MTNDEIEILNAIRNSDNPFHAALTALGIIIENLTPTESSLSPLSASRPTPSEGRQ